MKPEEYNTWEIFDTVSKSNKIKRILLYGKPGTGKTTKAVESAGENGFYSITVTEESSIAEILGMWIPKGKKFKWFNGLAVKAWTEEKLLVINEIDKASGSVLTIFNAILDDRKVASLTLPNGDTVRPGKRFKVVATMNGRVNELPESLADRFDIKLNISSPCKEAILSLPEDLQHLVEMAYSKETLSITYREILAYSKLRDIIGQKAFIVFGDVAEDVKSAIKLGVRPVDVSTELLKIKDLDDSERYLIIAKLKNYWNDTEYEALNASIIKEYATKLRIPIELINKIDIAFSFKASTSTFKTYRKQITLIYQAIIDTCKLREESSKPSSSESSSSIPVTSVIKMDDDEDS